MLKWALAELTASKTFTLCRHVAVWEDGVYIRSRVHTFSNTHRFIHIRKCNTRMRSDFRKYISYTKHDGGKRGGRGGGGGGEGGLRMTIK